MSYLLPLPPPPLQFQLQSPSIYIQSHPWFIFLNVLPLLDVYSTLTEYFLLIWSQFFFTKGDFIHDDWAPFLFVSLLLTLMEFDFPHLFLITSKVFRQVRVVANWKGFFLHKISSLKCLLIKSWAEDVLSQACGDHWSCYNTWVGGHLKSLKVCFSVNNWDTLEKRYLTILATFSPLPSDTSAE